MPEQTPVTLNHFSLFSFSKSYFGLSKEERRAVHKELLSGLQKASDCVEIYQVYPVQASIDILIWSAVRSIEESNPTQFFTRFAQATNPYREYLNPHHTLWGFTRPSQYTKSRSTQELDPFTGQRKSYLVVYPFVKTAEWYLMSREVRQGMMNEHIRIGKEYPEITQLLLYSFGLQDQEFVVVYEFDNLTQFSDLVYVLRDTEARRYTSRDTPNFTALYHPAAETLALWE